MEIIKQQYPEGGLINYTQECLRRVFTEVLIHDNYFWRVYATGDYTRECCPNHLKEENFALLNEASDRIYISCNIVSGFLRARPRIYTYYELMLQNNRRGTKVLMRSAAFEIDFLPEFLTERLRVCPEPANTLHQQDRIGACGSVLLAEVK
ncbi:MAG: hypothetical protein M2R45_00208 [Verrucomicrobia subdivision 3 bacterium]|nr:hypothetical protein [Limisphaerales bacterium]MCS1412334.1 hypothetical protein [Limisphaerales bacterium]